MQFPIFFVGLLLVGAVGQPFYNSKKSGLGKSLSNHGLNAATQNAASKNAASQNAASQNAALSQSAQSASMLNNGGASAAQGSQARQNTFESDFASQSQRAMDR